VSFTRRPHRQAIVKFLEEVAKTVPSGFELLPKRIGTFHRNSPRHAELPFKNTNTCTCGHRFMC